MKVAKTPVIRLNNPQADTGFRLDGRRSGLDRENVLDLLVIIDDERRFHAAAAVLTENPIECERYRALASEDSARLANLKQGLAHVAHQHLSPHKRARQLERYVDQEMDWSRMSVGRHGWSTTNMQGDSP